MFPFTITLDLTFYFVCGSVLKHFQKEKTAARNARRGAAADVEHVRPGFEYVEVDDDVDDDRDLQAEPEIVSGPRSRRASRKVAPPPPPQATVSLDENHADLQNPEIQLRVVAMNVIHTQVGRIRSKMSTVFITY